MAADENPGAATVMTPLVYVVGSGPVGTALAARMTRTGIPVLGLCGRDPDRTVRAATAAGVVGTAGKPPAVFSEADVIVIAVKDSDSAAAARDLVAQGLIGRRHTLLHTSGAWPAETIFRDVRDKVAAVGTLHPLASLNRGSSAADLEGVLFAIEGDPVAQRWAARLVQIMRGRPVVIQAQAMALYHAGAALGSNAVVALLDLASRVLQQAGVPVSVALPGLLPLVRSTVDNLERLGSPAGLTGPVARADLKTVHRHLEALDVDAPFAADVYRRLGQEILRLAQARDPQYPADVGGRVAQLLAAIVPADGR